MGFCFLKDVKMKKLIYLTLIFLFIQIAFAQKTDKNNFNKLIVGKWVNEINKTKGGKEYLELNCKDTIHYLLNGQYIWKQCGINETGKWKISTDRSKIILYNRKNKKWEKELETKDIGEMEILIFSLSQFQLVTLLYLEIEEGDDAESGEIHQFYTRQK